MNWLESLGLASIPVKQSPVSQSQFQISETESEEEEPVSKSQCKREKKINAQSSQIKDL